MIDVGMNRTDGEPDGRRRVRVRRRTARALITPVPGGVGPMTIAMLLRNTLEAAKAAAADAAVRARGGRRRRAAARLAVPAVVRRRPPGVHRRASPFGPAEATGWQTLAVIDVLLALLALPAIARPDRVGHGSGPGEADRRRRDRQRDRLARRGAGRVPARSTHRRRDGPGRYGIWLALAGALIAWIGSWLTMRDESTPGASRRPTCRRRPAPSDERRLRSAPMLSRDQVLHVARLARLELTDEEVERFGGELSKVLDHIELIGELGDLDGRPATSHVDRRRERAARRRATPVAAASSRRCESAPDVADDGFRVPSSAWQPT